MSTSKIETKPKKVSKLKKAITIIAATVLIGVGGYTGTQIATLPTDNGTTISLTPLGPHETITTDVMRVVDGDTIIVSLEGKATKVRLIGVDTPETVHPTKTVGYYGKEASDFTKSVIESKTVRMEFDKGRTDFYGRTLAYVYLQNGDMLNLVLLNRGYGKTEFYSPNTKYKKIFLEVEGKAKASGLGVWDSGKISVWESVYSKLKK